MGLIKRRLSEPYRSRFERFINMLHVKCFYNGDYPKDSPEEEFNKWLRELEKYVKEVESEIAKRR